MHQYLHKFETQIGSICHVCRLRTHDLDHSLNTDPTTVVKTIFLIPSVPSGSTDSKVHRTGCLIQTTLVCTVKYHENEQHRL